MIHNRLIFAVILILISLCSIVKASASKNTQWKKVLEALQEDDKRSLEFFFRTFLKDSYGGYVLFGEKPICIESLTLNDRVEKFTSRIFSSQEHKKDIYLRKGYDVWAQLPIKSQKYLIRLFNEPFCDGKEFVILNKRSLEKVVSENLSLFQYVLGPKLDASNFLDAVENTTGSFYGLVKNDRVLIGILLGYGVENALRHNRCVAIDENLWDYREVLPLRSSEERAKLPAVREEVLNTPICSRTNLGDSSFAFSTIMEEKQWLDRGHKISYKGTAQKNIFPLFEYWENEESERILSSYLKSQQAIEKILQSENFLEVIFERLFSE